MTTTEPDRRVEDVLRGYAGDLLGVIEANAQLLEGGVPERDPDAQVLVMRARFTIDRIGSYLDELSTSEFGGQKWSSKVINVGAKFGGWLGSKLSGRGEHGDAKVLRDQSVFLNVASVGCAMFYATYVSSRGANHSSDKLLQIISELNGLIVEYNRLIPRVVINAISSEETGFDPYHSREIMRALKKTRATVSGTERAGPASTAVAAV